MLVAYTSSPPGLVLSLTVICPGLTGQGSYAVLCIISSIRADITRLQCKTAGLYHNDVDAYSVLEAINTETEVDAAKTD